MRVLVTGGAGFIGSHLVDALLERGDEVRILDDLSTGHENNLASRARFIHGSVSDPDAVARAIGGVEIVYHQAALGSVPRSIENPLATDEANVRGTLTVLEAARRAGVRRVVFASSSSVYGGVAPLPTREEHPVMPRSPYAVSKVAAEYYCAIYATLLGVETICLRYFNVYGPRQRADSPYAAAIPRFISALVVGEAPVIFGNGMQTRDFTFVADAVQANLHAAGAPRQICDGRAFNIAGGQPTTIRQVIQILGHIVETDCGPVFEDARPGDVPASHADITAATETLAYRPSVTLAEGLRRTVEAFNIA